MEPVIPVQSKNRTTKYWYAVFLEKFIKRKDWAGARAHMPLNIYLWDNEWTSDYDRKVPLLFCSMFNPLLVPYENNFGTNVLDVYMRKDGQIIWVFAIPEIYHESYKWFLRSRYNRMYTRNQIRWMYSPELIMMLFTPFGVINTIMAQETKKILLNDKERRRAFVNAINDEYNMTLREDELEVLDTELAFCTDEILCTPGFGSVGCCADVGVRNYDASITFLEQYYDL